MDPVFTNVKKKKELWKKLNLTRTPPPDEDPRMQIMEDNKMSILQALEEMDKATQLSSNFNQAKQNAKDLMTEPTEELPMRYKVKNVEEGTILNQLLQK